MSTDELNENEKTINMVGLLSNKHKTFVSHLYKVDPTSSTLV